MEKIFLLDKEVLSQVNGGSELSEAIVRLLGYWSVKLEDGVNDFIMAQSDDVYRCKI